MDRHERDEVDGQLLEAAARGYRLANMEQENDGKRHVYQFNRLHFNVALILQFLVWAIGIYANYAVVQQRVANLEKQMEQVYAHDSVVIEKLNHIEVDVGWLKDTQRDEARAQRDEQRRTRR